jgi:hypothetical protein
MLLPKLMPSCSFVVREVGEASSGKDSAYRLPGRHAPLAGVVPGFAVMHTTVAGTAAAVLRFCTAVAGLSPAATATAGGLVPPDLASKFPKGQVAALAIISIEARGRGGIRDLRIDEIATRSATGSSTVHSALKTAKQLGLLTVEVRHRLPNLIRIVSPDWLVARVTRTEGTVSSA